MMNSQVRSNFVIFDVVDLNITDGYDEFTGI